MAEYRIIKEGQIGKRYVYNCVTWSGIIDKVEIDEMLKKNDSRLIKFSINYLWHPLKSANGFRNHLEVGADRALAKLIEEIPEIEETYTESEVTAILREKNIITVDEEFSKDMPVKEEEKPVEEVSG